MPKRDAAPIGAPCWVDLFTSDPDKSRAFYGRLFGWTSEDAGEEYGGYINFFKDGVPVAGCMRNDGSSGTPDLWSVYLATDDAQATGDAAVENGGQVLVPAMKVMDLGTMVVVTDPGQAAIGAWQPGLHHGFGILAEPGTQLAGIMDAGAFLPEGVPASWSIYFGVDDTDAALATTVDLGGAVVVPAEDTPYGRLAQAEDPTGARFKLVAG